MEKLLTIAIPTYNGGSTIKNALDSIINQIVKQNLDVNVFISINPSNDQTLEICEEYKNLYPNILSYKNNEKNIGYDLNVHNCMLNSNSKYTWTFSDNEILTDELAIKKVLDFLEKYQIEFLYLNHDNFLSDVYQYNNKQEYFEDSELFFSTVNFYSGLITNCVFNVETWKSLDMPKYDQCEWIHFAYQIESLAPCRKHFGAGIIYEQLYDSQPIQARWGRDGTFIYTGFKLLNIFKNMPKLGYSKKIKKLADKCIRGGYPQNIFLAKKERLIINANLLYQMFNSQREYLSFWLRDLPILLMPRLFSKLVLKLFYK